MRLVGESSVINPSKLQTDLPSPIIARLYDGMCWGNYWIVRTGVSKYVYGGLADVYAVIDALEEQ